jgi:hypothetical protein
MGILIVGVIIVVGALSSMSVIHGSKREKEFMEWVNK